MATITGFTAERMLQIENETVVGGLIVGDDLVLTRRDAGEILAGNVRGPQGIEGPPGAASIEIVTSATRPVSPPEGLFIYETDTDRFFSWNGSAWVYRGGTIICTSSTRPSSPHEGMKIYETDTDRPYLWNGSAWIYQGGIILCTAATRPASPFAGLQIYETDTHRTLIYKATHNLWLPPWNTAWGKLAGGQASGGGTAFDATNPVQLTLNNVPVINGRLTRLWFEFIGRTAENFGIVIDWALQVDLGLGGGWVTQKNFRDTFIVGTAALSTASFFHHFDYPVTVEGNGNAGSTATSP